MPNDNLSRRIPKIPPPQILILFLSKNVASGTFVYVMSLAPLKTEVKGGT